MLGPRESDVPALFLFLVVFPLVTYILLGKWSEVAERKERITLLAQLASEEDQKAEAMAVASVMPPMSSSVSVIPPMSSLKNVSSLNNVAHECAQCLRPATTCCSQCKSVRYCSGKCQILHWRLGHKHDCQQLETFNSCSSPKLVSIEKSIHESALMLEDMNFHSYEHKMKQPAQEVASLENKIYPLVVGAHSPTVIDASTDFMPPLEKIKMLFEEFVKFFHFEVCDLSPRGLLNCGNSCYANAVLQCLTFTRPLVIYFLQRSHSRACCVRNWCLMCELEHDAQRKWRGYVSGQNSFTYADN